MMSSSYVRRSGVAKDPAKMASTDPSKCAVRSKTGAEGCKQSNNQELCETSGRMGETTCEGYTGEGRGKKMNNYIPNGAFCI
jgi:hypothetical protein